MNYEKLLKKILNFASDYKIYLHNKSLTNDI